MTALKWTMYTSVGNGQRHFSVLCFGDLHSHSMEVHEIIARLRVVKEIYIFDRINDNTTVQQFSKMTSQALIYCLV